jgi:hypothetical protein
VPAGSTTGSASLASSAPPSGGKHEIVVALKTRDLGEAKVRVLRIAHEAEKALQRLVENTLALRRMLERASGTWRGDKPVKASPAASQVMEAFLRERQLPSKTEHEVRATFARFNTLALDGEDKPIEAVTREDVRRFRSALLGDEAKSGKGKGALAPGTVKKYVNPLATVFKYAERTG